MITHFNAYWLLPPKTCCISASKPFFRGASQFQLIKSNINGCRIIFTWKIVDIEKFMWAGK